MFIRMMRVTILSCHHNQSLAHMGIKPILPEMNTAAAGMKKVMDMVATKIRGNAEVGHQGEEMKVSSSCAKGLTAVCKQNLTPSQKRAKKFCCTVQTGYVQQT